MPKRKVTYSETAPSTPTTGDGWIHSTTRVEKIWAGAWIPVNIISMLTVNDTWSGMTAVLTAGEVLALGNAVYLKAADSEVYKALATATTTMPSIAVATCATIDGNPFEFLLRGFMRHDAWGWTAGGLLYIDRTTAGLLTHTIPVTLGDQVQVVGIAITADIIFFSPSLELVEIS